MQTTKLQGVKNVDAFMHQESVFNHARIVDGKSYSLEFSKPLMGRDDDNKDNVVALAYKLANGGNTVQRMNIYAFRRNIRFVEDTPDNVKALAKVNKLIDDVVKSKGNKLTYGDLKPVYDIIDALDYVDVFSIDEETGEVSIPTTIEVHATHPKLNLSFRDVPTSGTKLRYSNRAYKMQTYRMTDGVFEVDAKGSAIPKLVKELIDAEEWDSIIDLYDVATLETKAAKDPRNLIFNNAICIAK